MIFCCGEALIDMLPRKTADGETAFVPHVGGSIFNSAIALGRLGAPVSFFSGLSNDLFGKKLQNALAESQVDLRHARLSDRPTTLAFVTLDAGHASYVFYDENSAGRMLGEADLPALDDDVEALLFGGISLVAEPCGTTYERLMARESGHRVVMIDPNIRPLFINDEARHRARLKRMTAMADIVKISEDDLDWLRGAASPQKAARNMLDAGAKLVVITGGDKGATVHWRGGSLQVEAVKVEVVDTVGAGDTFNAGLLAALHEAGRLSKERVAALTENEIRAALSFAARVAAVTVSRAGANPPWRNEL